jgi:HSP20 family protein
MRWDPFQELGTRRGAYDLAPAFEVRETKDGYVFSGDLPGIPEDSVELSIAGNQLTISGHRQEETREDGERVHMYERRYGTFSRTFALPDGVDGEHIEAKLEHGVLTVTVPKKPEVKPRRISLGGLLRSSNKA